MSCAQRPAPRCLLLGFAEPEAASSQLSSVHLETRPARCAPALRKASMLRACALVKQRSHRKQRLALHTFASLRSLGGTAVTCGLISCAARRRPGRGQHTALIGALLLLLRDPRSAGLAATGAVAGGRVARPVGADSAPLPGVARLPAPRQRCREPSTLCLFPQVFLCRESALLSR